VGEQREIDPAHRIARPRFAHTYDFMVPSTSGMPCPQRESEQSAVIHKQPKPRRNCQPGMLTAQRSTSPSLRL
jgi:hypothetical protein